MESEKTYSHDFKALTVKLIRSGGASVAQIAKDLDLEPDTVHAWIQELSSKTEEVYPGKGHLTSDAEIIRQLKREKEQLNLELESLKKAAAIAKDRS
jgi:transposase